MCGLPYVGVYPYARNIPHLHEEFPSVFAPPHPLILILPPGPFLMVCKRLRVGTGGVGHGMVSQLARKYHKEDKAHAQSQIQFQIKIQLHVQNSFVVTTTFSLSWSSFIFVWRIKYGVWYPSIRYYMVQDSNHGSGGSPTRVARVRVIGRKGTQPLTDLPITPLVWAHMGGGGGKGPFPILAGLGRD